MVVLDRKKKKKEKRKQQKRKEELFTLWYAYDLLERLLTLLSPLTSGDKADRGVWRDKNITHCHPPRQDPGLAGGASHLVRSFGR